jgi:hypothetical protein
VGTICRGQCSPVLEMGPALSRGRPSPRIGPTLDSWKRPWPSVGGQGAALAVPLAISQGKRPPDSKEPRRRLAEGSRNTVFSRVGGPGTKFYISGRAIPIANCGGKRVPTPKNLVDDSRTGHETLFLHEWEAPRLADRLRNIVFSRAGGPGTEFYIRDRAVPRAICRGRRFLTRKDLVEDWWMGDETLFLLHREAPEQNGRISSTTRADGPRNTAFSRPGGPGAKFYIRRRAVPLANCRGKRVPTRKNLVDDSRTGDETLFFLEWEAPRLADGPRNTVFSRPRGPEQNFTSGGRPSHSLLVEENAFRLERNSSTTRGRATKHSFFSSGRPRH